MASTISIAAVVNVLLDDVVLIEGWNQLADVLGVRRADYFQEQRGFNNSTVDIGELFQRILFRWSHNQAMHGQPCTIGTICDKLGAINFNGTKDALEEQFGRDARLSTEFGDGNQMICSLKQKWWPEKKPLINSFVERHLDEMSLVAKLKTMFEQGEQKAVISPHQACISGLGGIGKTTLAKWFASYYADEFDHIVWFDCGEGTLGSSIDRLWDHTCTSQGAVKALNLSDRARQCFMAFGECKTLVIYDNAEEYTGQLGILDALPNQDQFHNVKCLITSRWAEWGSTAGHGVIPQLFVETFSLVESVQFLQTNLNDVDYNPQELAELSELLGGLPLALQISLAHANRFYSNMENGLSAYIETLKKSQTTFVMQTTDVDGYNKALLSIIEETKAKVVENNQLAWNILVNMAYLRCDLVGVRFLGSLENVDYDAVLTACQFLEKHSLLTITSPQDNYHFFHPKDKHYISVHRLVQRTLQILNSPENIRLQSKILCCIPKAPEDVWYKWEPFLAAKNIPQLCVETKVAKKQIYEVLMLVRFLRDNKYEDAMLLLELYKDVTKHMQDYNKCPHLGSGALSKFSSWIFSCKTCLRVQRQRTVVITVLTSYLLNLQGNIVEAVKSLKSLSSKKRKFYMSSSLPNLNDFIFDSPPHWQEHDLDEFEDWIGNIIFGLGAINRTSDDEIEYIRNNIFTRSGSEETIVPRSETAISMDIVVPKDSSDLYLYHSRLSYESCVYWLHMFPSQEFSSFRVAGIQLVKDSGSTVEDVDYHTVFTTKSQRIGIDCDREGSTRISFHLEELWHRTRELSLSTCRIIPGSPTCVMSNLEGLHLDNLIDGIPPSLLLGKQFPNLKHLTITTATLPFFQKI